VEDVRCLLVALRPEQPIPQHVTAGGSAFGHSLLRELARRGTDP